MSDMTEARVREILDGCEGVSPGPWETAPDNIANWPGIFVRSVTGIVAWCRSGTKQGEASDKFKAHAAHIARCDPDTVRSLCTLALSAIASRQPVEVSRADIVQNVAIYTIEDEHDHVYLTAFGSRLGRWHLDTPEAIATLKLCALLRLSDSDDMAEQRPSPALTKPEDSQ